MALGFGQAKSGASKAEDVAALIAKKQYAKAIEALKAQLKAGRPDERLRLQLADVLVLAHKEREAVMILIPLADEYAREGFAAKAISVLKKIQKIDPGRRDVGAKLAILIEEKQRAATIPLPQSSGGLEIGMEEIGIGMEAGPVTVPSPDEGEASAEPTLDFAPPPDESLSLGAPAEAALPVAADPAPVEDRDLLTGELEELEPEPEILPEVEAEALEDAEIILEPEPEAAPGGMSEALFADELMALVDTAFLNPDAAGDPEVGAALAPAGGSQIVVSPLFKDFSVDEMVAVIAGLNLLTFEPGDIILTEGEPGDSLYMLTTGTVKVLKKNAQGRQAGLGQLSEGAVFGEGSILTGKPRSATIVAASRCDLLELDRSTLDSIVKTHPHVLAILQEFARERLSKKP